MRRASGVGVSGGGGATELLAEYDWTRGDDLTGWTDVPITDLGGVTIDPTISAETSGGGDSKFLHLQYAAGTGDNERHYLIPPDLPDVLDVEIRSLWRLRGNSHGTTAPQFGHCHRLNDLGLATQKAYVVSMDAVFGQNDWINVAAWTGLDAGFLNTGNVGAPMRGLIRRITVYRINRTTNVNTATIEGGHGLAVGDSIHIDIDDNTFDGGQKTVTAVTATTVSWAQTAADVADKAATGYVRIDPSSARVFPLWVASRTAGPICVYKAWPQGVAEPGWDDSRHVRLLDDTVAARGPTLPGQHGIVWSHLSGGTEFMDYGPVSFSRVLGQP